MQTIPIILEIEASGFSQDSFPVELGVVDQMQHRFCTLIKPMSDWQNWDNRKAQLLEIAEPVLTYHGRTPQQLCDWLNERYQGETLYCKRSVLENRLLPALYEAAGTQPSFQVAEFESLLTEPVMDVWEEEQRRVRQRLPATRHRASYNAFVLQQAYRECMKRIMAQ